MKFSLVAAIVLLALAQGNLAQYYTDFEQVNQYLENMKNKMTQEITEIINKDLAGQAQTFLENGKTHLEPLTSQIQDQLKTMATNMEEQIRPLAANMQAQMQPMFETFKQQMEAIFQKVTEQKAIGN